MNRSQRDFHLTYFVRLFPRRIDVLYQKKRNK